MSFRHSGIPAYLVVMEHDGSVVDVVLSSEFPLSCKGHGMMRPGGRPTMDTKQRVIKSMRGPDFYTAERLLVREIYRDPNLRWVFGARTFRLQMFGPNGRGYYGQGGGS